MTTRDDIVRVARDCLETRWVHQAAVKGVGADCIGVLKIISNELDLPDKFDPNSPKAIKFRGYAREPAAELLDAACKEYLNEIPVPHAGLGDIYRMWFVRDKAARHFAVISCMNPLRVIHGYLPSRKVVESGLPIPGAVVVRAFRFRGVD